MTRTPPIRLIALALGLGLLIAACGGGDDGAAPTADGSVEVEAGDLYFDPENISVAPGELTVTLVNVGSAEHDFIIEELGDLDVVGMVQPGQTATGTVDLEPGTYTFYCSVPGHRAAGMEGTLQVG